MSTQRKARRERRLRNWLARQLKHRLVQGRKMLRLNRVVIPSMTGDIGWGWDEEAGGVVDEGGPVAYMFSGPVTREEYRLEDINLRELQEVARTLRDWKVRPHLTRLWPEDMVKLNWTGELVPLASVLGRVQRF